MGVYFHTLGNKSDMQGPCSSGFHIPTKDEWEGVYNIGVSLGIWSSSSGDNMKSYLKLPYAGYRASATANQTNQDTQGYYWSCIHRDNSFSGEALSIKSNTINYGFGGGTSNAYSIRPFKDTSVTPDSSWTALYSDKIYHNSTLGLISISSDGTNWVTIADKNLGATTVYNSGDALTGYNCGYYFQWGNNHGFAFAGSVTTSSTKVDASNYGPGNYYNSITFITVSSSPYTWDTSDNYNLWGGVSGVPAQKELQNAYIGEYVPPIPYLCFTANTAGSTVKLQKTGSPTAVTLETSTDGSNWSTYTIGNTITLSNIGDKVYWRNTSETDTGFSTAFGNYYQFVMTGSIAASGDVNYLLNKNSTTTLSYYCFFNLFSNCASLTSIPDLLATTLNDFCYRNMFYGCSGITEATKLPATTVSTYCYYAMFSNCTKLISLPKLSATNLKNSCYAAMFSGCSKIKLSTTQTGDYQTQYRVPISGTGTDDSSLSNMFYNTGGTFTGTPNINTTYYTSNTVV